MTRWSMTCLLPLFLAAPILAQVSPVEETDAPAGSSTESSSPDSSSCSFRVTRLGILTGGEKNSENEPGTEDLQILSFCTNGNRKFNEYLSAGFGGGMDFYSGIEAMAIPIFLDLRGRYKNTSMATPYVFLDYGFSFGVAVRQGSSGNLGVMTHYGVGVELEFLDHSAFLLEVGRKTQQIGPQGWDYEAEFFALMAGHRF